VRRAGALLLAAAVALGVASAASPETHDAPSIEHTIELDANGARFERWLDLRTGRARLVQGKPGYPVREVAARGEGAIVELDYRTRTVTVEHGSSLPPGIGTAADPGAEYRSGVRRRIYEVVARTPTVLHLRHFVTFPNGSETTDVWVDPVTFLPIERRWRSITGRMTSLTTYEWLPRTAANLRLVALVVPPGFTRR
jgi:hypothetical protein